MQYSEGQKSKREARAGIGKKQSNSTPTNPAFDWSKHDKLGHTTQRNQKLSAECCHTDLYTTNSTQANNGGVCGAACEAMPSRYSIYIYTVGGPTPPVRSAFKHNHRGNTHNFLYRYKHELANGGIGGAACEAKPSRYSVYIQVVWTNAACEVCWPAGPSRKMRSAANPRTCE